MARPCNKPLKANPFVAQRDPKTGRWRIVKPDSRRKSKPLGDQPRQFQMVCEMITHPLKGMAT
jgi:hypothetical protein